MIAALYTREGNKLKFHQAFNLEELGQEENLLTARDELEYTGAVVIEKYYSERKWAQIMPTKKTRK